MWYFVVVALAGGGVLQRSVVAGHSQCCMMSNGETNGIPVAVGMHLWRAQMQEVLRKMCTQRGSMS